jgi:hypothetical protein
MSTWFSLENRVLQIGIRAKPDCRTYGLVRNGRYLGTFLLYLLLIICYTNHAYILSIIYCENLFLSDPHLFNPIDCFASYGLASDGIS